MMNITEFLEHYGKRGMKWGIRNKKVASKKVKNIERRKKLVKNRRNLSNADLNKFIERLSNEKKLKTLVNEDLKPGRSVAKRIVSESGQRAAKTVLSGAAVYATKALLEKKFDTKVAATYLAPRPKNK